MMQVSQLTLETMKQPRIWRALLEFYFPYDAARLRRQKRDNYAQEFKASHLRDNSSARDYGNKDRKFYLLPPAYRKRLRLFKEGLLKEIKEQDPPVTLKQLFDNQFRSLDLTPIEWAAKKGHQSILDYFYSVAMQQYPKEAGLNASHGEFFAPKIFWIACFNQLDALKKLLQEGTIQVNADTLCGKTALHIAAQMGHEAIVRELLPKMDVNVQDTIGCTPYLLAASGGHLSVMKALSENGANSHLGTHYDYTPLMTASKHSQTDAVLELLHRGANVNSRAEDCVALTYALERNQKEVVSLLLEAKAEVNIHHRDRDSSLKIAAHLFVPEIVKALIERKADINERDHSGNTPVACAAWMGDLETVETLLAAGADWPADERHSQYIKELRLIKEIDTHLAGMKESKSSQSFFSNGYKQALEQLKKAIENGANHSEINKVWWWHPLVFRSEPYKALYEKALLINPQSASSKAKLS